MATVLIFAIDVHFPIGFAPWLPYFLLALPIARLYDPRILLFATAFWSVAIMGEPFLPSHSGESLPLAVFNRSVGIGTLWILTAFLYFDAQGRRARQRSEAKLQAIVEGALDAVVAMDRHGTVVEWNPQAERIFGFSREEAMGKPLVELIVPGDQRAAHIEGLKRYLATGTERMLRQRIEVAALRKNGARFPAELTVIPLMLGKDVLFSSFIRDISERQRAEDALRQTTAFIESLFEHLPDMVFVKDAQDLRFVRFNKAGEALLGYSRSDLLGKNDYDFFPKQEADFFTAKDRETLAGGCLIDIPEEPVQTKDMGVRLLHTKKIPICDDDGTPRYLLGISEDVTERKEAEAELVRARLAAEAASKAKSDFLANMSHEMRTPLNAIMGMADYLARTPLSPQQLALVERCTKASDALLRMIEDLLLTAKAESGTLTLTSEPFVLREIMLECTNLLGTEAQGKGLTVTTHLDPAIPARMKGDPHRFQQVLLNLVRNAIKFTEAGSITVQAKLRAIDDAQCKVQFAVADTGIGIIDELRDRLFERFSQADSRANRHYGGVGLGLAICRQLVDLMGGRIWVESAPGQGSTFSFTIPFGLVQTGMETQEPSTATARGRIFPSTMRESGAKEWHVLLAEDSIESQHVMRLYLSKSPYRLDCADSGTSVVETFKSGRYDLVLMDLHMPDIDGCEATRRIRAWETERDLPRTPIVALTADGFAESRQRSAEAGCDDFLTKPVKMDTVLSTIRRFVTETKPTPPPGRMKSDQAGLLDAELNRMRPKFLQNRRLDIEELQRAVESGNFDQIKLIGHRIKGLAGTYGLHAIGAIGGALEEAAVRRHLEHIRAGITDLRTAVEAAQHSLSSSGHDRSPSPTTQ
ncbi:PAS domain S-box protein [Nitrospira japonica]|uniref:PAS domain S-box protein n=1 Tax=Nitrospira japonica TaxID=1325564 RepID=UPI001E42A03C|nr:PAS domain S-box protein [Nitrospira japonica]